MYGSFYCTMAMHQLGGEHWQNWFPFATAVLTREQQPDGSWQTDISTRPWGDCLTTALAVMAMSGPDSLLPIFQR